MLCVTGPQIGGTRDQTLLKVLGCKERGHKSQGPLVHATGKGWVKEHKGQYYDALHVKNGIVKICLVESQGGIAPPTKRIIHNFAKEVGSPGVPARRGGSADSQTAPRGRTDFFRLNYSGYQGYVLLNLTELSSYLPLVSSFQFGNVSGKLFPCTEGRVRTIGWCPPGPPVRGPSI